MIVDLVSSVLREDWSKTRQILYQQWLAECPKLYTYNHQKPWENLSEEQFSKINSTLFTPLVYALCGSSDPSIISGHSLAILKDQIGLGEISRAGQICGHVFKSGELTYSCNVCATDPTCVMCHSCFHKSEHKNHKYKIHSSNGSGYCDCGDPDAWKSGYACPDHLPKNDEEGSRSQKIPEELLRRLKEVFTIILQYCCGMVCHEAPEEIQKDKKPPFRIPEFIKFPSGEREEITETGPYIMVLYNDETHTFDVVIRSLELHVPSVSRQDAMLIATIVDREGRCMVRYGTKNECDDNKKNMVRKTNRDINRRTDKSDPLAIHIFENEIVVNQSHAVALMVWMNQQIDVFPPLAEILGDILLNEPALPIRSPDEMEIDTDETLLVKFMRYDKKLWKIVRQNVHQMLMKTVLMKYDQKLALAKTYFKYYDDIYNDFIDDDHDLEMSIVSLAVQFLTVPSLARRLIAEDNVMEKVWVSLCAHTNKYCKTEQNGEKKQPLMFDFSTRQFPPVLKRALHMVRDLVYILNVPPTAEQWTDQLREGFIKGVKRELEFLARMQGMDEVKRQAQEHQVWEMEWESAFNIQIRIQEVLTLTQMWGASDKSVHREMMMLGLNWMAIYKPIYGTEEGSSKITHKNIEINGDRYICPHFDILNGVVSIHLPIWRFCAGLFAVGNDFLEFFRKEKVLKTEAEYQIILKIEELEKDLFEESLRVMVLCAQVQAQLWRRNGFSLVNQIHNYFSPICRVEMYDRDLLMLQVAAVMNDTKEFIIHVITRYRLAGWANFSYPNSDVSHSSSYGASMDKEETSKIVVTLAEEMLHLFINIVSERYQPGVGKSTTALMFQRELIHLLCTGSHPFSQMSDLMRKMANDPSFEKIQLHDIVNDIAECKKPTATSAGQFSLKEKYLKEYNPFFYHYSKSNVSAAELHQQKIRAQMDRAVVACPPPVPCDFEPFFEPVINILNSSVMIRLCRVVLERTKKRNRFSSDRLLHRALYLIGLGLIEQEKNHSFDYINHANAEDILKLMEELNGTSEAGTHGDLLWWTIQKYKEIDRLISSGPESIETEETVAKEDSPATAKARRAEMAAKIKTQAMLKIKKMQSKFIGQMTPEETAQMEVDKTAGEKNKTVGVDDDDDWATMDSEDVFPVCLGVGRSKIATVLPRKVTCMLCQEQELLQPGKGNYVCAAYVQRSMLFAHGAEPIEIFHKSRHDFVPASLPVGLDTSTCSHVMHFHCYQNQMENILNRERNRPRQPVTFHKMIDIEMGEYNCFLCKRLSNTALPVLPAVPLMSIKGFSAAKANVSEDFDSWVDRLKQLLDPPQLPPKTHSRKRSHSERSLTELAKAQDKTMKGDELSSMSLENTLSKSVTLHMVEEGSSTRSSSENDEAIRERKVIDELTAMMQPDDNQPKSPTAQAQEVVAELARHLQKVPASMVQAWKTMVRSKSMVGPMYEKYNDSIKMFGKFLIKTKEKDMAQGIGDFIKGYLAAVSCWQSTVHVMRTVSSLLQAENKPLFGALNTRQRDCISALTRLSASLSWFMQKVPYVQVLFRAILCAPPMTTMPIPTSPRSPLYPTSPIGDYTVMDALPAPLQKSFHMLFFITNHQKYIAKDSLVNILHIDMLNLALGLAMMIGYTYTDGRQSFKVVTKEKELIPDGSQDELYCIRLCLIAHLFQVMATFEDSDMAEEEQIGDATDGRLAELWLTARPEDEPLVDKKRLRQVLREAILLFLRPLALFYNNLTMISPPEALRDPSVDEFEPLCRYMGLPSTVGELFEGATVVNLFHNWSSAIPSNNWQRSALVRQPVKANQLIELPEDFSDLIQMATTFRCPTVPFDEPATNIPTICLVCGTILCSQSYCCQKTVGKETMGACRYHMQNCSGSVGLFLRIRDCIVVLMTTRHRGCIRPAPYVDEFGESDQGFRRGNPLHLNHALYHKLKQLWMTQGIAEEVVNQFEIDHRNIQFDFVHL